MRTMRVPTTTLRHEPINPLYTRRLVFSFLYGNDKAPIARVYGDEVISGNLMVAVAVLCGYPEVLVEVLEDVGSSDFAPVGLL
jgi:hypothetical protein